VKRVFSAKDPLLIEHLKNVLSTYGIVAVVKNSYLSGAVGELPPIECWPELWVVDDARAEEALELLNKATSPLAVVRKPRFCDRCDEEIEWPFDECWNCGG
jgi:hypothetical protein